ncbi:hypothetical protein X797_002409 [Metarhizium robertsii]|uniref:Uncharacterized protein n=2 Tax=Metarhizium robertsii TaxID=568076 RepID=A0A0A1V378_9HYPO|nr:hypothetical protein X797_002409 [Metarhizium robertsii]
MSGLVPVTFDGAIENDAACLGPKTVHGLGLATALAAASASSSSDSLIAIVMSSRQVNRLDSSRLSDRHHDYYASERQSGRSATSKVPDQENIPQGLNESYYRETAAALGMPMDDGSRSHSVPLPTSAVVRYPRSPSISSSRSSSRSYCSVSRDNEHSPGSVNQTRGIIQSNFSQTRAGIGAGIVGAVIGGLVAKQASEAAFRHKQKQTGRPRRHSSETIPRMASTVLGAVAGALGANAVTHRWEDARERNRSQQLTGGKRYDREDDTTHYDTGRLQDWNHANGKGYLSDAHDYHHVYRRERQQDDHHSRRRRIEESQLYHYRD